MPRQSKLDKISEQLDEVLSLLKKLTAAKKKRKPAKRRLLQEERSVAPAVDPVINTLIDHLRGSIRNPDYDDRMNAGVKFDPPIRDIRSE